MPLLTELLNTVDAYQYKQISADQLEDWFRTNARGMFGEESRVLEACLSIDAALSEFRYGGMPEEDFRGELMAAVQPLRAVSVGRYPLVSWNALVFFSRSNSKRGLIAKSPKPVLYSSHPLAVMDAPIVQIQQKAPRILDGGLIARQHLFQEKARNF